MGGTDLRSIGSKKNIVTSSTVQINFTSSANCNKVEFSASNHPTVPLGSRAFRLNKKCANGRQKAINSLSTFCPILPFGSSPMADLMNFNGSKFHLYAKMTLITSVSVEQQQGIASKTWSHHDIESSHSKTSAPANLQSDSRKKAALLDIEPN